MSFADEIKLLGRETDPYRICIINNTHSPSFEFSFTPYTFFWNTENKRISHSLEIRIGS
jgi:hypothetical protein